MLQALRGRAPASRSVPNLPPLETREQEVRPSEPPQEPQAQARRQALPLVLLQALKQATFLVAAHF